MNQNATDFKPDSMQDSISGRLDEYVTIIAPSLNAVMAQFRERGLGRQGFSITGPAARHQFAYAGENVARESEHRDLFGGVAMVAATFRRAAGAV
jgi:hypothetical protein